MRTPSTSSFRSGERVSAEVVGFDPFDDVGLLKVDPAEQRLDPVPLGDSSSVVVGDPVAAIGSPFGQTTSLSVGVVSATERSIASLTSTFDLVDAIQTDTPINRGNSGGPLFDARGRVIGINAQIRSDSGTAEGVGFAVPINSAKRSMEQLIATGEVRYAWVGVSTQTVTPAMAEQLGLGRRTRRRGPAGRRGQPRRGGRPRGRHRRTRRPSRASRSRPAATSSSRSTARRSDTAEDVVRECLGASSRRSHRLHRRPRRRSGSTSRRARRATELRSGRELAASPLAASSLASARGRPADRGHDPARRLPRAPAALRRRELRARLCRPSVQHRPDAASDDAGDDRPTPDGDRNGFAGRRYRVASRCPSPSTPTASTTTSASSSLASARCSGACFRTTGTLYLHLDYREAHYAKVLLDEIFGRDCFLNEIVWAYDYGARPRRRWPAKHDTILVYVKDRDSATGSTRPRSSASPTWHRAS